MNKLKYTLLAIATTLILSACGTAKAPDVISEPVAVNPLIHVSSPTPNQIITSPFTVKGEARGAWFFEGSFPVELQDADGKVLNKGPATAQGEWMTEKFVSFSYKLTFDKPKTATGKLIFHKDNPSGLSENEDQIEMPVRF